MTIEAPVIVTSRRSGIMGLALAACGLLALSTTLAQMGDDVSTRQDSTDGHAVDGEDLRPSPPRHRFALLVTAVHWEDANSLSPKFMDFVTRDSGRFKTDGYGIEFSYHHRQRRLGRSGVLLGGEFAFYSHSNETSAVGFNAISGESSRIKLWANWGHFTGSGRLVWREGRRPEIHTGGGLGLYLLRIKESLEGFGVADRHESDSAVGGFLCVGLHLPYRNTHFGWRLEGKVHSVSFGGLGGAFSDQHIEGPVYTLQIGVTYSY